MSFRDCARRLRCSDAGLELPGASTPPAALLSLDGVSLAGTAAPAWKIPPPSPAWNFPRISEITDSAARCAYTRSTWAHLVDPTIGALVNWHPDLFSSITWPSLPNLLCFCVYAFILSPPHPVIVHSFILLIRHLHLQPKLWVPLKRIHVKPKQGYPLSFTLILRMIRISIDIILSFIFIFFSDCPIVGSASVRMDTTLSLGVPWLVRLMTQTRLATVSLQVWHFQFTATAAESNNGPNSKWNRQGLPAEKESFSFPLLNQVCRIHR